MASKQMTRDDFRKALQELELLQSEFALIAGRSIKTIQDNLSGRISKSECVPLALASQARLFLFLARHHKEAWSAVKNNFLRSRG